MYLAFDFVINSVSRQISIVSVCFYIEIQFFFVSPLPKIHMVINSQFKRSYAMGYKSTDKKRSRQQERGKRKRDKKFRISMVSAVNKTSASAGLNETDVVKYNTAIPGIISSNL